MTNDTDSKAVDRPNDPNKNPEAKSGSAIRRNDIWGLLLILLPILFMIIGAKWSYYIFTNNMMEILGPGTYPTGYMWLLHLRTWPYTWYVWLIVVSLSVAIDYAILKFIKIRRTR